MKSRPGNLPEGFVYLDQIEHTIIQQLMYYDTRNFVGKRIKGYNAPRVIVTKEAALALKNIQQDIKNDNYSLLVYDAYRPVKAVQHFVEWGKDTADQKMKESYYPYINKDEIFQLGYVSKRSAHSRGSTVDLTIIELDKQLNNNPSLIKRTAKDDRLIPYWNDNSVDMFSSVDLADPISFHDSKLIEDKYLQNRNYLREKMTKHGFAEYHVEWWHYTLQNEPYKDQYFDFNIA